VAGSAAYGQEPPAGAPADLTQAAEARGAEWGTLAANLEQRAARMLPCDARVKAAIEEVMRASDARFAAMTALWRYAADRSQEQAGIAHKLASDAEGDLAAWKAERADSEQEQKRLGAQIADLRESMSQQRALGAASNALSAIAKAQTDAAQQAADREDAAMQWKAALAEMIRASEARQAAVENEIKALAAESARWNAYYAARIARAQMECSLTGSAGSQGSSTSKKGAKGR
jgi:chromosome segregation ATPase